MLSSPRTLGDAAALTRSGLRAGSSSLPAPASETSGGRQRKLKVAHILLEKDKAAQMPAAP